MKKKLLFFIVFFLALNLNAAVKYSPFLDKQIKLAYALDENNLTQENIHTLINKQEILYANQLYIIMANKQKYIDSDSNKRNISTKIFSLKKIIAINKRAGNRYAVLRDEVQLKSYLLVSYQYDLLKNVLMALDLASLDKFEDKLNIYIIDDQKKVIALTKVNYNQYLNLPESSRIIKALQHNIKEFQSLYVNNDINNKELKEKQQVLIYLLIITFTIGVLF